MRKVAFVRAENAEQVRKVMLYEYGGGVYLFGYDTVYDKSGVFDEWYETVFGAEERCAEHYGIRAEEWIAIGDPLESCNHDYIMPVRIKGRDAGKPQFGQWEILRNGAWREYDPPYGGARGFDGLPCDERLSLSGLADEFENARQTDKPKAEKILAALEFDEISLVKLYLNGQ